MSLNRAAIRTAMVAAFNNFGVEPYPTLAGAHVFDSKIEPIDSVDEDVAYPMVVVYTDYDKDHLTVFQLANEERVMSITIELLMGIIRKDSEVGNNYVLQYPVTDSELEMSLDILEHQCFEALRADNTAANAFRSIAYGIDGIVSRRGASSQGGTKIAARQITMEARCLREPAVPKMLPFMNEFLTELADSDGFSLVGAQLKQIYDAGTTTGIVERLQKTQMLSNANMAALGGPYLPLVTLPDQITWLNADGSPLV